MYILTSKIHSCIYRQDRVHECRFIPYTSGEDVRHVVFFVKESDDREVVPVCKAVGKYRFRDKQTDELEDFDRERCDYKKREGLCHGDIASEV